MKYLVPAVSVGVRNSPLSNPLAFFPAIQVPAGLEQSVTMYKLKSKGVVGVAPIV
jgi:hypothetical protein